MSTRPLTTAAARAQRRVIAHRAENDLGFGMRRDHVGRDAAADQADGVMRRTEQLVRRPGRGAHVVEHVEQLLDRRLAELGISRVRCAAVRRSSLMRNTPRVASASRLSVGSPLIRNVDCEAMLLAAFAPSLPRSSPATNTRPMRVSPRARSASAAATCAARMPFASQAPRP